jgi:hypothetical protein
MSETRVINVPVRRRFLVAGFDATDLPRSWGAADELESAIERAASESSAYIEEKRALGERVELRLFVMLDSGGRRDLQTTIRHEKGAKS